MPSVPITCDGGGPRRQWWGLPDGDTASSNTRRARAMGICELRLPWPSFPDFTYFARHFYFVQSPLNRASAPKKAHASRSSAWSIPTSTAQSANDSAGSLIPARLFAVHQAASFGSTLLLWGRLFPTPRHPIARPRSPSLAHDWPLHFTALHTASNRWVCFPKAGSVVSDTSFSLFVPQDA